MSEDLTKGIAKMNWADVKDDEDDVVDGGEKKEVKEAKKEEKGEKEEGKGEEKEYDYSQALGLSDRVHAGRNILHSLLFSLISSNIWISITSIPNPTLLYSPTDVTVEVSHSDLPSSEAAVQLEAFVDMTLKEGKLKLYSFADASAKGISDELAGVIVGAAFDRPSPVQVPHALLYFASF